MVKLMSFNNLEVLLLKSLTHGSCKIMYIKIILISVSYSCGFFFSLRLTSQKQQFLLQSLNSTLAQSRYVKLIIL